MGRLRIGFKVVDAPTNRPETGGLALFLPNRHLGEPLRLEVTVPGSGRLEVADARELEDGDREASNTRQAPERVRPRLLGGVRIEGEPIETRLVKASKGQQKICTARYGEIVMRFAADPPERRDDVIEVSMPLGLYTSCNMSAPCGLCSTEGIIGVLDVPDLFLDPRRMQAALLWFGRGHVEYKFPNNAKSLRAEIDAIEFSMELSSEVPGTNADWPSDITVWVNDVRVGTWTSPGDYGDRRGIYTPRWWKLEGSQ